MMRTFLIAVVAILCIPFSVFAQAPAKTKLHKKGDFYLYWGYNRSGYTTSDIRFTGPGYDFTLQDVQAHDRPTEVTLENYAKPANMTIPQYVYRIGYFISDRWALSAGMDHMKYVLGANQTVAINGSIQQPGNPFNGDYNGEERELTSDFLHFEHTDGLNYASVGADYFYPIYTSPSGRYGVSALAGAGLGLLIPKSNVTLMGGERNDEFHIAGWGASLNLGAQAYFFKYFFFRTQLKGGWISMQDILTRPGDVSDRAHQNFGFGMWDFAVGGQFSF